MIEEVTFFFFFFSVGRVPDPCKVMGNSFDTDTSIKRRTDPTGGEGQRVGLRFRRHEPSCRSSESHERIVFWGFTLI